MTMNLNTHRIGGSVGGTFLGLISLALRVLRLDDPVRVHLFFVFFIFFWFQLP